MTLSSVRKSSIVLLMVLLLCAPVLAEYDLVVSNSNDWVDVYNSLVYGSLTDTPVIFIADQSQANAILPSIPSLTQSVLVVESDERISPTVSRVLESAGYDVEVLLDDETSFFFADLVQVDQYILVDKDFPSNGISVAPYAVATNSWVFFVQGALDSRILEFIDGEDVVTYGRVSQSVLQSTNPGLVIDRGNRYMNSVAMAKEFLEVQPARQFVLAEGSFLESEFFTDDFPVLIVGISSTPAPIQDFFVESDVGSAVVVGQLSVPPSINLKRFLESTHDKEIKLVAKLGQTTPETGSNEILPLNTFPIPSPTIEVEIASAFYNQITAQLEIRFTNVGDVLTTFVPSVELDINGETVLLEADEEEYLLEKSESRTIQFPVEISSADEVSAAITVVYGESKDSFDSSLTQEYDPLDQVSILDDSQIEVVSVSYDSSNNVFLVEILNNGSVPTYVDASLIDIIIGGETQVVSSPRAVLIQPQETGTLVLYVALSDADILANAQVNYDVFYGQRDFALIKRLAGTTNLQTSSSFFDVVGANSGILVGAIAVVVIIVLLFFIFRKSTYQCKHCAKTYKKKPASCASCGSREFYKR